MTSLIRTRSWSVVLGPWSGCILFSGGVLLANLVVDGWEVIAAFICILVKVWVFPPYVD